MISVGPLLIYLHGPYGCTKHGYFTKNYTITSGMSLRFWTFRPRETCDKLVDDAEWTIEFNCEEAKTFIAMMNTKCMKSFDPCGDIKKLQVIREELLAEKENILKKGLHAGSVMRTSLRHSKRPSKRHSKRASRTSKRRSKRPHQKHHLKV
jgi:hypothetical protein